MWLAVGAMSGLGLFFLWWHRHLRVRWHLGKLRELAQEGPQALVPIINMLAISDTSCRVRRAAAAALVHLGPAAIPPLVEALRDRESKEGTRQAVAYTLGKFHTPQTQAVLVQALQDPSLPVRRTAAEALGDMSAADTVQPLIDVLAQSQDALLRIHADLMQDERTMRNRYIGSDNKRLKSIAGVTRLRKRLGELSEIIRTASVALGKMDHPRIAPVLLRVMAETRVPGPARQAATEALRRHGRAVAPTLVQALQDTSGHAAHTFAEALVTLLGEADPVFRPLAVPLLKAMLAWHPDWVTVSPSPAAFEAFCHRVALLPPVGGKIPLTIEGDTALLLPPSWSAEEQIAAILRLRQQGRLGKGYVHQLSVQGRLPDDFKYVSLALIISSPYPQDWATPFFQAPWGKVAPLVHDGGTAQASLNPLWQDVPGRTDFLQRVVMVYEPALEELEGLSDAEQLERLGKAPRLLEHYHREREERVRLAYEAKAYQRLALALHAATGRAPEAIPANIRKQLAAAWGMFQEHMASLLGACGARDVAEVRWFRAQPQPLAGWYTPRYEADWEPIQQRLIRLEAIKEHYPQLQSHVITLLQQATTTIDLALGFAPPYPENDDLS